MTKPASSNFSATEPGAISSKALRGYIPKGYTLWSIFLLLATFFFFLLPLVRLFALSFFEGGTFDLRLYGKLLSEARIRTGIANTVGIVAFSTVLAAQIVLPAASSII